MVGKFGDTFILIVYIMHVNKPVAVPAESL